MAVAAKKRRAVLRQADARRAAKAAFANKCTVEVVTESGLRFRFSPAEAEKPERNPWDDVEF